MTWFFALPWPLQTFWIGLAVVLLACVIGVAICAWEDFCEKPATPAKPTRDETIGKDQFGPERRAHLRLIQGLDEIQKHATKGRVQ